MTRAKAIEILKKLIEAMQGHVTVLPTPERIAAIRLAIASLETDEAYQLEYERTTKNDLGVDWESYKDIDGNSLDDLILEVLQSNFDCGNTYGYKVADEIIGLLPSVTPQDPKTGHWINKQHLLSSCSAECSSCHKRSNGYMHDNGFSLECKYYDFCPKCGCRMVEPQESEDT